MKIQYLLFLSVFLVLNSITAQDWELHLNVNEVYPTQNNELGYYPVLWYNSDREEVLLGGFCLGVSMEKAVRPRVGLLTQLYIQRSRFRDNPVVFQDINGSQLGNFSGVNTSYSANLFLLPNLKATPQEKLSFGAGLGLRAVINSMTNYGEAIINGEVSELKFNRRSAAPFVVYVPLRVRYELGKIQLEAGFDWDISNASRLQGVREKYFTLQSGISFNLNRSKK